MKIKISWGTGIVIAFIAFISFILFFVIRMTIDAKSNHDLVSPDYYQRELHFQEDLAAQKRAKDLATPLTIKSTHGEIMIAFPATFIDSLQQTVITGSVSLSKPDNKNLDQNWSLKIENGSMLIPASKLVLGRWNIVVDWTFKGQRFLVEEGVTIVP